MNDTILENRATTLDKLRVDQVGSLVPPDALKQAHRKFVMGEISAEQLHAVQDKAVAESIRRQEDIGLPILTDGEFRRSNFQDSFAAAVSGYDVPENAEARTDWREAVNPHGRTEQKFELAGPAIRTRRPAIARLALKRNVVLDEYKQVAPLATKAPVKVALLGPDRISQRFAWEQSQGVYKGLDDFIADVVAIERQMITELVAAGCRYIHMDAPGFTAYMDQVSLERMRSRGEDPQKNLERAIKAENDVIAGFDDVTFGLHLCRGNTRSIDPKTGQMVAQWHREGHYDAIAEQLFSSVKHQRLLLEYDSPRAGDFTPLRYVSSGTTAVLGLVTTKSTEVEQPDFLRRRIDEAAKYLPIDQMAISPQCGFSSDIELIQLPEDVQWRKFESLMATADKVWGNA
ncbi:MAG TPA: cobalamin-independent methionine synthase II family protein [Beijerinckiaceae bacterium]|jgi:5-methyltetrahydropteroyltriglutamate--homocysteine methyltransferase|nr:cobalamin-independent methionine synthase II family protein [Beijerinckiaceae bacterium]